MNEASTCSEINSHVTCNNRDVTMKKARPIATSNSTAGAIVDDDDWSCNTGRTTVRASNVRKAKSVRLEQCVFYLLVPYLRT